MAALETVTQIMVTVKFILVWFWWAILLLWIFFMKFKYSKWPLEAVIIEKRGNNLIKSNDRIGKFFDKFSKSVYYQLQKANENIPVLNYDWVLHNNAVHTTLFEKFVNLLRGNSGTIFLFRYGSKQYKPIKLNENGEYDWETVTDDQGKPILVNRYIQQDPRKQLGALDFEVVDWDNMNQMVQEWEITNNRRKKATEFWKQLAIPALMIGGSVIVVIIMIKFGYDYAITMKNSQPINNNPAKAVPVLSDIIPG